MRAMILAAGLGTRLQPLTDKLPKALVKICDKSLLEIAINNLVRNGFDKIIINVHHFAEQVIYFSGQDNFGADITISDERVKLLYTGGGLKKASRFFKDGKPFLLYNVDIISNLNLQTLYQANKKSNSIATLIVRKRKSSRYFLFNSGNILCGWKNIKTGELITSCNIDLLDEFAFNGIHIIDPKIFSLMPDDDVFSMIDLYLDIMKDNKIIAHIDNDSFWLDVGKTESLKIAEENFHLINKP
ncbi:MAG: nucleotidyltransferase family protein [Bacteroidetes bacterium]|nr:nucleotidyltransferase family protein [Bacteroidota bacterium]